MAQWTLNAGRVYPPSGTLEPRDVLPDGCVDVLGSMRHEILEETGLDLADAPAETIVSMFDGPRIAIVRRFDFPYPFSEIESRYAAHRRAESHSELDRIEPLWNASQIDSRMPPYVHEIMRHFDR